MYKKRLSKDCEPVRYNMPSLDRVIYENDVTRLQKTEDIEKRAYQEGFASGEKAGFATGEEKAAIIIERLQGIVEEMAEFKDNFVKDLEPQVVDLSVAIARKILIDEINANPGVIVTVVKEALRRLQRIGAITIKINPALLELFTRKKPELLEIHQEIVFDVDPHVPLNGPFVISQAEEVVTNVDTLLANVIEEMRGKIGD